MADDMQINVPDIGGAKDVDVIEVMVQVGDQIEKDQSLVTLEGDKATMDIPSSHAGIVEKILIKVGDKVSQGVPILILKAAQADVLKEATQASPTAIEPSTSVVKDLTEAPAEKESAASVQERKPVESQPTENRSEQVFAGPAVRRIAREFGVSLAAVKGSGRKSRISKEDVQNYVKERLKETSSGGFSVSKGPVIDFSQFGEIETKPLNKIKRLTGVNVHRSWVTIPHVTQFDEADITDLEAFRQVESENAKRSGYKLTLLAFVCKVISKALQVYPQFNSSLNAAGDELIYKKYCHLGIAVETPNGLVVPVIQNVDKLSVAEVAIEMARLSTKAREKGLSMADMSGGCFTISSLGGIGGTAFTPIVNAPEVAILGLSRSSMKPVYRDGQFIPRLMLPLSLSYDHRVIDGAEAARFTRYIAEALNDLRRILL